MNYPDIKNNEIKCQKKMQCLENPFCLLYLSTETNCKLGSCRRNFLISKCFL